MRAALFLLGFGLVVLSVYGLLTGGARWLIGLDLASGMGSLFFAALAPPQRDDGAGRARLAFGPYAIGIGLLVLGIAASVRGAPAWLAGWQLLFAIAELSLSVGVILLGGDERPPRPPTLRLV